MSRVGWRGGGETAMNYRQFRKALADAGCFRSEVLVSEGDLRVEVAKSVETSVYGNSEIRLGNDSYALFCRDVAFVRKSRDRTVHGWYDRRPMRDDAFMIQKNGGYSETVLGGVYQHASVEAESMVGGVYMGNQVGISLRLTAFGDFMSIGIWNEFDAVRLELAGNAIRAYFAYAHFAGLRATFAHMLTDSWITRTEKFATLTDSHSQATITGSPGALTLNES